MFVFKIDELLFQIMDCVLKMMKFAARSCQPTQVIAFKMMNLSFKKEVFSIENDLFFIQNEDDFHRK